MIEQSQESRFAKYIPPAIGCLTVICITTAILAFMYFTTNDEIRKEPNTFPIQNSQASNMQIIPIGVFEKTLNSLII